MTSIRMTEGRSEFQADSPATRLRRVLLACGVLSTLLYAATDVGGGLLYPGYSFTSQTISELGAIGAPTAAVVGVLFFMYDVLALLFGVGVVREAGGRNRALRITGTLLIAKAVVGLAVATQGSFFAMEQRGAGSLEEDAPHIILMGVIVLLLLLAMGFGAFALGRRFRIYSLVSLLLTIVFGALTASFAATIGAGQATPGAGIIERIDVYTPLLWIAVLAAALLRSPTGPGAPASAEAATARSVD